MSVQNQENTLTICLQNHLFSVVIWARESKVFFNRSASVLLLVEKHQKDQRVYFVNTKELVGNKYGTPNPVPFRVVDNNIGLDIDISIKCFGEYSYRIANPILFYTNVCGNVEQDYEREEIDGQLKSELMTALQPAFAKISEQGIRYSALPGHTQELLMH